VRGDEPQRLWLDKAICWDSQAHPNLHAGVVRGPTGLPFPAPRRRRFGFRSARRRSSSPWWCNSVVWWAQPTLLFGIRRFVGWAVPTLSGRYLPGDNRITTPPSPSLPPVFEPITSSGSLVDAVRSAHRILRGFMGVFGTPRPGVLRLMSVKGAAARALRLDVSGDCRGWPGTGNWGGSVQDLVETIRGQDPLGPLQQGRLVGLLDTALHHLG